MVCLDGWKDHATLFWQNCLGTLNQVVCFVYIAVAMETGTRLSALRHVRKVARSPATQRARSRGRLHILCSTGVGHLQDLCRHPCWYVVAVS